MESRLIRLSKFMSLILRHEPEKFDLTLDAEGFAPISELLAAVQKRMNVTEADLRAVVATVAPEKQRFAIAGEDIRANYGHSIETKIKHEPAEPPAVLFHGTAAASVSSILAGGLRPMARQYVHLTTDRELAVRVGGRHGRPALLVVDATGAHGDGILFYKANRTFWLVDALSAKYLSVSA